MRDFWLGSSRRRKAADDTEFARVAGASFGGLNVQPLEILTRMWAKLVEDAGEDSARLWLDLASGRAPVLPAWWHDLGAFSEGWWMSDVLEKWTAATRALSSTGNPRWRGPLPQSA
jgi:hypothetical protein